MKFFLRICAAILIVGAIGTVAYTLVRGSDKIDNQPVFADRTLLSGLWNSYKLEYWESSTGRTLDKQQNNITTSEGQSYTMLRAVWQSDKPTFDTTWSWTKEQLQRKDKLFSWRWGKKADNSYGILTDQGGQNTASDADADIALALTMAAARWQEQAYLDQAKDITKSIWDQEVITANGVPYLASNNLEKTSSQDAVINPSYFSPYAYRIFAKIDKSHDWMKLVDSSYDVIAKSVDMPLDKSTSAKLVPDWILINKTTGTIRAPDTTRTPNLTTNYSYDAMRTVWRLALDAQWNNDPRVKSIFTNMAFLEDTFQKDGKLVATYAHDGSTLTSDQPPEVYGTSIGYFMIRNPELAKKIYDTRLKSLYDPNNNTWSQKMNYYSDNWTWFGIALYNHQLDNLSENL